MLQHDYDWLDKPWEKPSGMSVNEMRMAWGIYANSVEVEILPDNLQCAECNVWVRDDFLCRDCRDAS